MNSASSAGGNEYVPIPQKAAMQKIAIRGGLRNIDKLGEFLMQYPDYKVLVDGGVNGDRVRTRGYGEEYPVADNDTAASRQLNRRGEVIMSDKKGNIATR